ncbi:MAG: alpha amylase C-terminal domain-containing protein [Gammaproteobacteria bacterium]|nr:alpha amylase C-terminal domain-containing protein [Gammaproteobacteria bacterium]
MNAPSVHLGMGARLYPDATSFRVWAPNADSVSVAGTFNDWSDSHTPLAREHDGCWSVDVQGVRDGDQYRFVIRNGSKTLWRIDPRAVEVTSSIGNAIVRSDGFDWPATDFQMPSRDELVIYELHAGTFFDKPGPPPGSIDEVAHKLGYLRRLGVTCIELMPATEFPADYSWGYNPAHLYAIEQSYGGPTALKRLVAKAHERGIAVVLDVVYNHLGPDDLDLYQFDGWQMHDMGGIYFYQDWRSWTPWGERNRPDYGRPQIRRFLCDNALRWLEEFRLDGLRLDMTAYIRSVHGNNQPADQIADGWTLLRQLSGEVRRRQAWKLLIAEDLQNEAALVQSVDHGGAGFDSQWDAGFVHPIRAALIPPRDEQRDMHAVAAALTHDFLGDPLRRVIYTESHDEVANGKARVPQEIAPTDAGGWYARKRSTLGAVLTLTAAGIPMILQGQELLEDEYFRDTDPVDWSKLRRFRGIHKLYRDLIRLRRNWFDQTRGLRGGNTNVFHVNQRDKLIAYHRWVDGGPGDDVIVLVNLGHQGFERYRIGMPRAGTWRVRLNTDSRFYSPDYGDWPGDDGEASGPGMHGLAFSCDLGIAPYSALVLSQ